MSMHDRITGKLIEALSPAALEVINESHMHSVPKASETHFKVVVVSDVFADKSLVQRHRMINTALADELGGGVHALSIQAFTPAQWQERGGVIDPSPPCLGGSKADG